MDRIEILFIAVLTATAVASRLPFLKFPIDDDFAIFTYIARFKSWGLKWKKDLFLIGNPIWRMHLQDMLYGDNPEKGVVRIRLVFMLVHCMTTLVIYFAITVMTQNAWAAFMGAWLYAFYGSSPDYTAGNYSQEQMYIPLVFLGLTCLWLDLPLWAGLVFGMAILAKWNLWAYIVLFFGYLAFNSEIITSIQFLLVSLLPPAIAYAIEWKLGYLDEESRRQYLTRLQTTLRLTLTKGQYFEVFRDVVHIVLQTLPVWIFGMAGLVVYLGSENALLMAMFAGLTFAFPVLQRVFSRYHYQPVVALMSLSSGMGMYWAMQNWGAIAGLLFVLFLVALGWNLFHMLPFYLQPLSTKTLSRCEKFDQYIYLPYLGKVLKRLLRMRKEQDRRIFVWGTFSQLYHLIGQPASDTFLHHCGGPWNTPKLEAYFDSVIGGLIQHQPVYLIQTFHDLNIDKLKECTGLDYRLMKVALGRFPVYRLHGFSPPFTNLLSQSWVKKMEILHSITDFTWFESPEDLDCRGKPHPGINELDLRSGRVRTGIKELKKLCGLNPYDVHGLFLLAKWYDRLGQADRSLRLLEWLRKVKPNVAGLHIFLAKHLMAKGKLFEAEQLIQEDIRRFGNREEPKFYLGRLCQLKNRHQQAIGYFEIVCTGVPDWIEARFYMAESWIALEQYDQARKAFEEAYQAVNFQSDADWLKTRAATGIAELDKDRQVESATLLTYIKKDSANEHLAYALASALEREGDIDQARQRFQSYTESFTKNDLKASAWFRLARLSSGEGKVHCLNECLKLNPWHEGALTLLKQQEIVD